MATKDPITWREIKKEWIKFILEQYLSRNDEASSSSPSVEIKDFTTARKDLGQGFQSDLITLDIKAEVSKNGGNPSVVDYSYKVKFLPENPVQREMIKTFNGHIKEYLMYSQVIKDLNKFQAPLVDDRFRINIPELIYGNCTEEVCVLVMENLKEKGYEMVEKSNGLDGQCMSVVIDQLSHLHAVSYVYNKKVNLLKDNPLLKFDPKICLIIPVMTGFLIDTYVELLQSKGKTDAATRLEAAKAIVIQRGTHDIHNETVTPKCLIHGDFWNNNIMFSYKDDEATSQKIPDNCKIIDWSNPSIGNPLFDLFYLIYISTTLETRKSHLYEFLKQYYNNFIRITTELGSAPSNWSFDDFQREWHKVFSNCLLVILSLVIITQSKEYLKIIQRGSSDSVLDRPLLLPLKKFLTYISSKVAKKMIPWMYTERGLKMISRFIPKQYKGVIKEILSGENESLTDRIFDILCEADEKNIFQHSSENSCS